MLPRRVQNIVNLQEIILQNSAAYFIDVEKHSFCWYSTGSSSYAVLPAKLKKTERKPFVRSLNELKRDARLRRKESQKMHEIPLQPPENGMLVKSLVPIAHEVYAARAELFSCVSKVVERSIVYFCSLCGEVHVGNPPHKIRTCNVSGSLASKEHSWELGGIEHVLPNVESFHLYDRIGRAVSHNERLQVDRIPAILELCIQAGVDIPEYPTRRRTFPVYSVTGRIIDFEKRFPKNISVGKGISTYGFWNKTKSRRDEKRLMDLHSDNLQVETEVSKMGIGADTAVRGMEARERMRSGASKLMEKYAVQTCGYCSEVQVGPKGHRVRNCQAYKHQMRAGQHAWQEATVDDLIPPVYVWHVQDADAEPMIDSLKRYYGMLPAVIKLFAKAGAKVSENYAGLMREDVAVPRLDEEKLVV